MTLKPKTTLLKLPLFFTFLIAALIIYSCRKDNNNSQAQSNSQIDEARAWYENTFPVTNKISGGLQTQGAGKNHDLTQWIKPDWQHPNAYIRNGESVIEMPIDPASKFASSVKLNTKRFNPKYSRSYYLVIHDSTKYNAYILTIVADSSYVGNDLSKLGHNTYRKHDADFTGSVLYFTPKGDYLGGYGYNNGKLMEPGTPEVKAGSQQINSVHTDDLKDNYMKQECTDWYIVYYKDGEYWYDEYLTTTCTMVDDGSGQGGGGSGPPPPPPPCPAGSHPGPPVIRPCIPPAVASVDNGNKVAVNYVPPPPPPGDDGLPPPPSQSCSVDPPREPCPMVQDIIIDLSDPCLSNIANKLKSDNTIQTQVTDMLRNTFGVNDEVNITFSQADLTQTNVGQGSASTSGSQLNNLDVVFNTPTLANASKEYLTETFMHEIYHAYLYVNPTVRGNLSQHLYMAQNYVNAEVAALKGIYKSLSQHDALCLVISGYGDLQSADPNSFNSIISAYNLTLSDIVNTNKTFKDGVKGTSCE